MRSWLFVHVWPPHGASLSPLHDSKTPSLHHSITPLLLLCALGASELQRHVAAKNVAGISAIIGKDGVRGYFETFGLADTEKGHAMEKEAIFRLMSMTKPVIALAAHKQFLQTA